MMKGWEDKREEEEVWDGEPKLRIKKEDIYYYKMR